MFSLIYLCVEAFALSCRCVGVGGDGGTGVDVICVDVVADAAAHRTAVIPAAQEEEEETWRLVLVHVNKSFLEMRKPTD